MNQNKFSKYCIVICLFFFLGLSAQDYKKINIGGKEFYQYQVEKSEGFYALTRKFGATQEEIISQNPETKDGLKVGQIILVPVKKGFSPSPASTTTSTPTPTPTAPVAKPSVQTALPVRTASPTNTVTSPMKGAFIEHQVERKETVFSISRMYHVDIDTIYKYNPETVKSLEKGSIVRFPASSIRKNVVNKVEEDSLYVLYNVKEKESLYCVSKKINVSVNDILVLNPGIENELVKKGDVLRISKKPNQLVYTSNVSDSVLFKPKAINKKVVKIVFLLPFMLDAEKPDPTSDKFIEFYQGALVAIDSLKTEGSSVDVYVYDTDKSDERIKSILLKPELKNADLIVGPAYTTHVKPVSDFAKQNKIRLIIPFSSKTEETFTNPYIYQCNTNLGVLEEVVAKNFVEKFKDKNIIILNFPSATEDDKQNLSSQFVSELDFRQIKYKSINVTTYDSAHIELIGQMMRNDIENVVLVMTTNPAILNRIIPSLNRLKDKEFSLFGFSEWHQLLKIQEEIFMHDTYMYSSFYLDYKNPNVRQFFRTYSNAFGAETTKNLPHYSLLGYDITFFFVNALRQYGNKLEEHLSDVQVNTLQTKFKYEKVSETGGYMNKNVFLIKYKDGKEIKIENEEPIIDNKEPQIENKKIKTLNVKDEL